MTMMLWLARQAHQQFAGFVGLLVGHAGGGLVHQKQFGVLRDQHADFQPLLLAVAQRAGLPIGALGQADGLEHFVECGRAARRVVR